MKRITRNLSSILGSVLVATVFAIPAQAQQAASVQQATGTTSSSDRAIGRRS